MAPGPIHDRLTRTTEATRKALTDDAFATEWQRGVELTMDDAVGAAAGVARLAAHSD